MKFALFVVMLGGCLDTLAFGQPAQVPSFAPQLQSLAGCYQFNDRGVRRSYSAPFRVPAEFEHQQYLLMACSGDFVHSKTIARISREIYKTIRPVVLVNDLDERERLIADLDEFGIEQNLVSILRVEHNSKWARDFGPTTVLSQDYVSLVDWLYCSERQFDDDVSISLSRLSATHAEFTPLALEGGNLLSNGKGVIVTSVKFLLQNGDYDAVRLGSELTRQLNASSLVVLEPLEGEATRHVDMFATFTSPRTVVVGSYDPRVDPVNAAILDRNARLLSQVKTQSGRLRVVRIPMGSQEGGYWRTYTNCIFANGVLLVPSYGENDDPEVVRQVLATYRRLRPGWRVAMIDASDLIEAGGALRCASLNITKLVNPLVSTPVDEIPIFVGGLEEAPMLPRTERELITPFQDTETN